MDKLSIKEKLIYSTLISNSIRKNENFMEDGVLDSEYLRDCLDLEANAAGYSRLDLIMPSILRLAKELNMSRNTIKETLKKFKEEDVRVIQNNRIVCHKDLFDSGYINLPNNLGIRGQLLVFYGFLEDRSKLHEGIIDTWASRLGELTGIDKDKIYDMLYKLHKKGLVQRLPDGRLKVVPINEE